MARAWMRSVEAHSGGAVPSRAWRQRRGLDAASGIRQNRPVHQDEIPCPATRATSRRKAAVSAESSSGDGVTLPLQELQGLAAALPMPARCDFWRRTLERAAQAESGEVRSRAWDGCLRSLIEEQATGLQTLLQGPAEASGSDGTGDQPISTEGDAALDSFGMGVALLRSCETWIGTLSDAARRQALQQVLADQLVQVVGRLHHWLVIEKAEGKERGEWFWRSWELLQWRQAMAEPLPAWWPPVQEQLVRLGALAWKERSFAADPSTREGQQAITRALTLLQALVPLHDPPPIWILQGQRELAERGLAAILQDEVLGEPTLRLALEWLDLMASPEKATATAVERASEHVATVEVLLQQLREGLQRLGLQHPRRNPEALLVSANPTLGPERRRERLPNGIAETVLKQAETLLLSNQRQEALDLLAHHLPPWVSETQRAATARLVATMQLSRCGAWKEAESLHSEAVRDVAAGQLSKEALAAELDILKTEGELLSHELSLALSHGSLAAAPSPTPTEGKGDGSERWQSLSRSQLGQDLWVLEQLHWKRGGFFVEFGATDGVLLSNSWLLEKHFNWQGICAEPNPKLFARLQKNRSCHLSPACVYRTSGERMRFVLADAYGGLEDLGRDDQHVGKRNAYATVGEVIHVTTLSLMDLLDQQHAPAVIDYLSIDTEGSELAILEGIDWSRYQFRCITVEHNFTGQRLGIEALLEGQGYQRQEAQWDDWYWKAID